MKKLNLLLLATILILSQTSRAQNVGINEDGSAPNPNAILDVKSFTKGILIPRMGTQSRLAIAATKGLLVYDTTTNSFWFNTGSTWQNLSAAATPGWSLTGNNANDSINFIGTTNLATLIFKVNNQPAGKVDYFPSGNAFWGYNTPSLVGFVGGATANAGFGSNALHALTTGTENTAVGSFALAANTQGPQNTAVGSNAMSANFTGRNNAAFGARTMTSNTDGIQNTAIGSLSMIANVNGSQNTTVGNETLKANVSGDVNTAIGHQALMNVTGSGNVGLGAFTGSLSTTGSENTFLGYGANATAGGFSNATAIGSGTFVDASNKVRIGNGFVTVIEGQVPFTTPSDGRFKYAVQEDVKGLDFIMQLRPVTYNFDVKRFDDQMAGLPANTSVNSTTQASYDEAAAIRRSGFIAQEVEQAANASGYDFSGVIKPKTDKGHYSLSYDSFVVPLVKSVQELQKLVAGQQKEIDELKQLLHSSK